MTNTTAPSYTPAPILPNYLSQSCQSISCTTPATPTTIYGSQTQCPSLTSQTYSVKAVSGATTYNWTVPTGWTITSGQNTNAITVKTGTSGQNGTINVQAANYCGQGGTQSLAVTINPGTPATPTAITGAASVCPNLTGTTYSITPVANASTYYSVGAAGNGTNGSIGCDILFGYSLEQNGPTLNGLMGYGNSFQATAGLFNGGAWVSYDPRSPSISYLGGQFGVSLGAGYSNIMTYSTLLR